MKQKILLLTIILLTVTLFFVLKKKDNNIYKDPTKTVELRVKDLLKKMTLQEKVAQLQDLSFSEISTTQEIDPVKMHNYLKGISYGCGEGMRLSVEDYAEAISVVQRYMMDSTRLGIPIITTSEALHGCVHNGATIFPQAIAQGSTFDPRLINHMAGIIAKEVKAQGTTQVLSPDLDLARELRWGRVEETFGEDPYLTSMMGVAFVKGFRSNDIICTPKHYVAHGSPRGGLNLSSVAGGERELRSLYLKPFEAVIKQADPLSIMNAYSSYDAAPIASSRFLLTDILRNELGFKGYVYSDWGSVEMLKSFHNTADSEAEAAMQSLQAGLDFEIYSDCFEKLDSLVIYGFLPESVIDTAVSRILRVKFQIGLFDSPIPEIKDLQSKIHTDEAINIALEVARESAILLKNENNVLPLTGNYKSIAVIGPSADHVQFGDYSWTNENEFGITPLEGMQKLAGKNIKLNYARGCDHYSQNREGFKEAIQTANKSDISIIFVGSTSASPGYPSPNATSGESFDLSDLVLPGVQEELIRAIYNTGKTVVVVLVSGKPFAIPWIKENIPAILVQWYPGEQGGRAIAEILFGRVNPSGKLNVSFPQSVGHLPVYYNHYPTDKGYYKVRGSIQQPGKDYVFSSPDPLWAFGHGLSYTSFDYQEINVSKELFAEKESCILDVKVKNTGDVDGKEVVQLYVCDKVSSVVTPVHELKRFEKVFIKAGETVNVRLELPINELALYNMDMKKVVESGEFELQVGSASDQIKLKKSIYVIER